MHLSKLRTVHPKDLILLYKNFKQKIKIKNMLPSFSMIISIVICLYILRLCYLFSLWFVADNISIVDYTYLYKITRLFMSFALSSNLSHISIISCLFFVCFSNISLPIRLFLTFPCYFILTVSFVWGIWLDDSVYPNATIFAFKKLI